MFLTTGSMAQKGKWPASLDPYFKPVTAEAVMSDSEGFLQRWMLLEPISKPNRTNTVFTDTYLRNAFSKDSIPMPLDALPKAGKKIKVKNQRLEWHAMDSKLFNVKLFRFATALKKQHYGVVFWAVTAVDCDEDIENVRMAVGSNSASMWWVNGKETVMLSGDRRMVKDDCMSHRITLRKGRNIIVGGIINGPGMSDFCVRFLYEDGTPVIVRQF